MKVRFSLIVILTLGFLTNTNYAQWQQTFGPFGWTAMNLASGNGYVYSSGGKIFRSSDNGMTWEEKGNGIWQWDAEALFVSDGRVFAGMGENGVGYLYMSDDNGESWMQHNTTGNSSSITGFTKLGSNLFFSTYNNSVFVSTDNGNTWTKTPGFVTPYPHIYCIVTMGNYLFIGTNDGLFRSSDNGNTWQFCSNPQFTLGNVFTIAVKNNALFIQYGDNFSQNFLSLDYGNSFTQIGGEVLPYVYNFFVDGNNVYANTGDGVYRTNDNGTSWNRIALEGESTYSMAVINGNLIVGTRNLGIFTSTNNGAVWINTGYRNDLSPQAIAVLNNALIVGNDGQTGVIISRNNGDTFTEYNNLSLGYVKSLVKRGSDIFAGTTPYIPQRGGVFKSTDAGLTWNFIGLPNKDIYSVAVYNNYLFAGSFYDGVFRTSNDGATWAQVNVGLNANWIKTLVVHNNILYAGTLTGLYSSTNNGNNWSLSAFQNFPVNSLEIVDTKLFAGTETGVYLLDANGNWLQLGLVNENIYCLKALGSNLIAGGYPELSISTDYGTNWVSIKQNIPAEMIMALDYNDTYLFAGTSQNGIWRRPLSEITGVSPYENDVPNEFALYQNYPNPFNPSTKISWQSPVSSWQSLSVYDILGNKVATLFDEFKPGGSYEVEFNGSSLASGVYYYTIKAGEYFECRKMVLIK